jgi:hypothetical protein
MNEGAILQLTDEELERLAGDALWRVFRELEPHEPSFADGVPARAILFPVANPLTPPQFAALSALGRAAGDDGFFRIHYEFHSESEFVPFDAVDEAAKPTLAKEVALLSESGRWGLLTDEDYTGLVAAANSELLAVLIEAWPATEEHRNQIRSYRGGREMSWTTPGGVEADDQWRLFVALWTEYHAFGSSDTSWIRGQLEHVYGPEPARQMLAEFPGIA